MTAEFKTYLGAPIKRPSLIGFRSLRNLWRKITNLFSSKSNHNDLRHLTSRQKQSYLPTFLLLITFNDNGSGHYH